MLKVIKTFFAYTVREGHIHLNPTVGIKNVKQPKVKIITFTELEIRRMLNYYVETINKEREHKEVFSRENIDRLSNGTFGDEIGTLEEISFLVRHELLDKVYDRFGLNVNVQRYDDKYSLVITSVVPNRAFFGWLVMMGEDLIIVSPEEVNTDFCGTLMKIRRNYHSAMYWNHYRSLFAYMWEEP